MMIIAVLFIVIAVILCAACVLGLLGVGQLGLSGSDAIGRDGLARGQLAPAWSLADAAGTRRASPPAVALQLIVFADHSLRSFPSVVAGLRELRDDPASAGELEIVVLTRGPAEPAAQALHQLGLDGIAVVTGSPRLYARYNVRVMPFVIVVDVAGRVRASSLVNHDWQLAKLRQVAAIGVDPAELAVA